MGTKAKETATEEAGMRETGTPETGKEEAGGTPEAGREVSGMSETAREVVGAPETVREVGGTPEAGREVGGMPEAGTAETGARGACTRQEGTEEAGPRGTAYVPVVMKDSPLGVRPCSMAAALEIVGEKWALLVLREMGYDVHRFAQFVGYTGAPRDVLTDRLRKLEAAGIIERRLYNEHPPRYEYHLTQAGRELFPAMISLLTWGAKWAMDAPVVQFRHTCGQLVALELGCGHCGEPVTRESLTPIKAVAADDQ